MATYHNFGKAKRLAVGLAARAANAQAEALNGLARKRLAVYGHRVHGIVPAKHHGEWLEPLQMVEALAYLV